MRGQLRGLTANLIGQISYLSLRLLVFHGTMNPIYDVSVPDNDFKSAPSRDERKAGRITRDGLPT